MHMSSPHAWYAGTFCELYLSSLYFTDVIILCMVLFLGGLCKCMLWRLSMSVNWITYLPARVLKLSRVLDMVRVVGVLKLSASSVVSEDESV